MDLEQLVYSLPSTQTFIQSVTDLAGSGVKIILLPDDLSREMVGRLIRNRADAAKLRVDRIFDPGQENPVTTAAGAMNVSWPSPRTQRTVDNLLRCRDLPDILYVHRIGPAQTWTGFIESWARSFDELRKSNATNIPALCVIAKLRDFEFRLPLDDPRISVIWWWGFPSSLEIRLACRIAGDRHAGDESAEAKWREYVLPALVGNDVQLAEHMWDLVSDGTETSVEHLTEYWRQFEDVKARHSIDECFEIVNANRATFEIGQGPPAALWLLWSVGAVVYTPEYGLELHPALLASAGRHATVDHMVWRGQSELLLPFVNEIRLAICQDFTTSFGENWPIKWIPPRAEHELQEVKRSPLSAEIGHVNFLLQNLGHNPRHDLYPKREFGKLTSKTMRIRNEIAHYDAVSYDDYVELCEERINLGI